MNRIVIASIGGVLALVTAILGLTTEIFKTKNETTEGNSAPIAVATTPITVNSAPEVIRVDIKIPESCSPAMYVNSETPEGPQSGLVCKDASPKYEKPASGLSPVAALAPPEFIEEAIKNSIIIDAHLARYEGTTGAEEYANRLSATAVADFAEFLAVHINDLESMVSGNPKLERALFHAKKFNEYKQSAK